MGWCRDCGKNVGGGPGRNRQCHSCQAKTWQRIRTSSSTTSSSTTSSSTTSSLVPCTEKMPERQDWLSQLAILGVIVLSPAIQWNLYGGEDGMGVVLMIIPGIVLQIPIYASLVMWAAVATKGHRVFALSAFLICLLLECFCSWGVFHG